MPGPSSQRLFELYQNGQSEAATAIFDRYVERLIALVRERLSVKLKRRVDPEDVVQSAYRSFFLHASDGEFVVAAAGDLWRLLAGIAINKLYGQIERHTAAKRTIQRETQDDEAASCLASSEPTAAEVVAIYEQLQIALKSLSADEQITLTASLQGQDAIQIAGTLGKSERTVRRLLAQARQQLEQQLIATNEPTRTGRDHPHPAQFEADAPLNYSDYKLEQLIGAGGMGKVFRARHIQSANWVAIKALHKARLTDNRAVFQFVQESQLLAKLHHPNIVAVQGLGRFPAGGFFLVMDYIDGIDLQSRLEKGPLATSETLSIIKHVAAAIEYAHFHGVIHCDLKPANVLFDQTGRAIVTDFGFAQLLADTSPTTRDSLGGTPGYIAPEILFGREPASPAADIYGLGALLWTLSTGSPPRLDLSASASELTPAIASICMRCLAKDPKQRYSTASETIRALNLVHDEQL